MEDYRPILEMTTLFGGIPREALGALLVCLAPVRRSFGRGELLLQAGQPTNQVGIVLTGEIEAYRTAPGGARITITHMGAGGVFGDVLGGSSARSPVSILAHEPCEVLFFPYQRLLVQCGQNCAAHTKLLQNLVGTVSNKYFALTRRIDLLVLKSLRAKVCLYLLTEAEAAGADTFTVRYSRAELADYLNCDRSALSREISRMQADGLIETYKSSFKLLDRSTLCRMYQQ